MTKADRITALKISLKHEPLSLSRGNQIPQQKEHYKFPLNACEILSKIKFWWEAADALHQVSTKKKTETLIQICGALLALTIAAELAESLSWKESGKSFFSLQNYIGILSKIVVWIKCHSNVNKACFETQNQNKSFNNSNPAVPSGFFKVQNTQCQLD